MIAQLVVTASLVLASNVCLCWFFAREIQRLELKQMRAAHALQLAMREVHASNKELEMVVEDLQHTIQNQTSEATEQDESDWWKQA